ncbi:hypothetical protein QF037_000588 [Streptomyces canus]|nr:hypothetical protein [Streptomyces canus]
MPGGKWTSLRRSWAMVVSSAPASPIGKPVPGDAVGRSSTYRR